MALTPICSGTGEFWRTDGEGNVSLITSYTDWRQSWNIIIALARDSLAPSSGEHPWPRFGGAFPFPTSGARRNL
jgi:hypothetical protein